LLNQFSPKQAVSTHGLFKAFKSSLGWMFWAFKLSFDVDVLVFWATFLQNLGKILFYFLVTLDEVDVRVLAVKS
jgi:hypothetical protein